MDEQKAENKESDQIAEDELSNEKILSEGAAPSFDKEINSFIDHITSLAITLEISMKAINGAYESTLASFEEFIEGNVFFHNINGERVMLVKAESYQKFEELNKQLRAFNLAYKNIPRSHIMSLISGYDAFLGRLFRVIFLTKPGMLNSSARHLKFSDLVEFGSVEDAKEFILEKEIETVLRKSHVEQFRWMENTFKIDLTKGLGVWCDFVEITERRNLFVHTGGAVSSQYLKICTQHNVNIEGVEVGEELRVSKEYFENAYNVIFEVGLKLGHVLWRKFIPGDLESADRNLIEIGYDTLYQENYTLTKTIFDFGTQTLKKHGLDQDRRIMIVNRALAYKWSGDADKAIEIVSQEDWSATGSHFRLAKLILLDDFEFAYELMRKIGIDDEKLTKEYYRGWPLFKMIKKEEKFRETFEEIFGEPYNKIEQEVSQFPDDLLSEDSGILSGTPKSAPQ